MIRFKKADEAFFSAVRKEAGLDSKTGTILEPAAPDGCGSSIRLCLIEDLSSYETSLPHSFSQLYVVKEGKVEALAEILQITADDFACVSDIYRGEFHEDDRINSFLSDIEVKVKELTMGGVLKTALFAA